MIRDCLLVAPGWGAASRYCGLSGGGANSELWCRVIADVLGVPTFRPRDQEVGAKGAMIVVYREGFEHFSKVRGHSEPIWQRTGGGTC